MYRIGIRTKTDTYTYVLGIKNAEDLTSAMQLVLKHWPINEKLYLFSENAESSDVIDGFQIRNMVYGERSARLEFTLDENAEDILNKFYLVTSEKIELQSLKEIEKTIEENPTDFQIDGLFDSDLIQERFHMTNDQLSKLIAIMNG